MSVPYGYEVLTAFSQVLDPRVLYYDTDCGILANARCKDWTRLSLVTIGISKEGLRIHDSLVVDQLILLVLGEGVELVVFGIPDDLVCFDDLGLTRPLLRLLDFVEDVLSHDVIVQLALAFAVEAETPHLAFDVTQFGLVAIVLGTRRHEFRNVVVGGQFTREVTEVIAQDRVGLAFVLQEDDGVRVVIQDTFPQWFEGGIESKSGPTGGETGHEDVQVG